MSCLFDDLLKPEVQDFLFTHAGENENALVLKHPAILGVPASRIAEQLAGRRKAKEKLPLFYSTQGVIYPPSVNIEQCSSELTAQIKVSLLTAAAHNNKIKLQGVDVSGGFGVDAFFLSRICDTLVYAEPDAALFEIARHNHKVLGADNILHENLTAEAFLSNGNSRYDFVYVDPSRRKGDQKVTSLGDCSPDMTVLLPKLLESAGVVLIKAAPLLDLVQGLRELKFVHSITVVAVRNECREVLFLCRKATAAEPVISCINLAGSTNAPQNFAFTLSEEKNASVILSDPQLYLYEPNAAILKAGAFKSIAQRFGLSKIHQHTHLYTSEELVVNFPGRTFKVRELHASAPRIKELIPDRQVNVITRNYPMSPDEIKKKFKLNDGGDKYLIGFSGRKEKFLVIADRIKNPSTP